MDLKTVKQKLFQLKYKEEKNVFYKSKPNPSGPWTNNQLHNMWIIGIPEQEEREMQAR